MVQSSFTKIADSTWGVRLFGSPKETRGHQGETVQVSKRDGGSKTVLLGSIVQEYNGGRTVVYEIAPDETKIAREEDLPGEDLVPAGFYVLRAGDQAILVKVWRKNGRVKTYLYGEPDDHRGDTLPTKQTLDLIVQVGPYDAAVEFGRAFKRCSTCGLRLKNRLSRELGIGPNCGRKFHGDEWSTFRWEAVMAIRARGLDEKETKTEREWLLEEEGGA